MPLARAEANHALLQRIERVYRRSRGTYGGPRACTDPPTAINQQWVGSVNRPRCCQDNAHMESFFHTRKTEWIRGRPCATFAELEVALKPKEYERLVA